MKKALAIISLALALSTSVIAGTLAMYTTNIESLAQGSAVAKEFILLENGTDSFTENMKIAPSETATWKFSVKNYDGQIVSETGMDLSFTVDIQPAAGKSAIEPLKITVTDENDNIVGSATANGTIEFSDEFALSAVGQEKTYTVTAFWPSTDNDINFAGDQYGTAVKVSVTGTQK